MFLLSKLLPFLKKPRKQQPVAGEQDLPYLGDLNKSDLRCKVLLLDDSEIVVHAKGSGKADIVLRQVSDHLNVVEREYFGLRYLDVTNQTHWLDPNKSIGGQLKNVSDPTLYFGVKFYAADPCKLQEEVTRYQVFLQVKRDVLQGRLPVQFDMAADLAAYALQSELGDYDAKRHSYGYASEFRFVPNQTEELEVRAMHIHRTLAGQVPSVAEYRYLDKVKWLEMYGVDLHPVQGEGNVEYFVGLTPTGVVVYRNKSKVGNYFWPRISKVTFRSKVFMVRVKDKNNDENTYAFECATKSACKHLWKCCVEHHAFFRLSQAHHSFQSHKLLGLGSKHRYSGRTERQVLGDSTNQLPPAQVVRNPSKRHARRPSLDSKGNIQLEQTSGTYPETAVVTPEMVNTPSGQRRSMGAPDSPRSIKSAPWESGHHRKGMYTSGRESPLSLRSEKLMFPTRRPVSGSDGEGGQQRKRHSRRVDSDAESDISSRRHRRRRQQRMADSGSESEAGYQQRSRHSRRSAENLTQAEQQWRNVQQQMNGHAQPPPHGSVSSMPGSEFSQHSKRSRRRRSKSPGNKQPPQELAQHFKYIEADPGLSTEQLRDIPYTKVETQAPPIKLKHSPHLRHRRPRSLGKSDSKPTDPSAPMDSDAPPPYSSPQRPNKPQPNQYAPPPSYRQSYPNTHHPNPYSHGTPYDERVQPPAAAYRNEAHTAPIVKTKGCSASEHWGRMHYLTGSWDQESIFQMSGPGSRQPHSEPGYQNHVNDQPYLEPVLWPHYSHQEPIYANCSGWDAHYSQQYNGYMYYQQSNPPGPPESQVPASQSVHSYKVVTKPAYIEQASSRQQYPPTSYNGSSNGVSAKPAYLPAGQGPTGHFQPTYGYGAQAQGYGSMGGYGQSGQGGYGSRGNYGQPPGAYKPTPHYGPPGQGGYGPPQHGAYGTPSPNTNHSYNSPAPHHNHHSSQAGMHPGMGGMHPAMASQFSPPPPERQPQRNRDMMTEL